MSDINATLNIESMRLSGLIFTGMDIKVYAKDPWFPEDNMGPFDNDEAAYTAYLVRSGAAMFTHGGKWYFVHSGERFGPYDDRLGMIRAKEARAALQREEAERVKDAPRRIGVSLLDMLRRDEQPRTKRTRQDLHTMLHVLDGHTTDFMRGDIVSLHPFCCYYPKIKAAGEALFIGYIPRQKMKPDAAPIEGLHTVLEADCHLGYFDEDGDFVEIYADSRFFNLAETSN